MFHEDQYVRLTNSEADAGYPKPIAGNWNGLPPTFEQGIDAAFWRKTNDKIYMFKGDQYVRLTETQVDPGYPKPIAGNWHELPDAFEQGIDAVFMHHGTNKIYMFKGSQYVRLTETEMDAGYPQAIEGNWPDLPSGFTSGLDAALMRWDTHKIYFFKGRTYVRYSNVPDGIDAGYPKWINKNWMPFPT